ncbi:MULTISPECIES: hypothetical protein [Intestinibacter]|uniref:hypothetical protein n=1 Tax=Intestinibacter TaxID=1505657 RepID=UPI0024308953|nr:hypothetical protein [Intestinibacter bartlettii]
MGLIVSNKKYKAALGEIERLKKERTEMRKIIVSKDIEINGLNIELKSKDGNIFIQRNAIDLLESNEKYYKQMIKILEKANNDLDNKYRDAEIELLLAIKKRCKKARVKTKYKNKILKVAEKRLLEIGEIEWKK